MKPLQNSFDGFEFHWTGRKYFADHLGRFVQLKGHQEFDLRQLPSENGLVERHQITLRIHFVHLQNIAIANSIGELCSKFARLGPIRLEIHLGDYPAKVAELVEFVLQMRRSSKTISGPVFVHGKLPSIADEACEDLMHAGICLVLSRGYDNQCISQDELDSIDRLTSFGFFIPLEFFVTRSNIEVADSEVSSVLAVTRLAGYSLPLVSNSCYYDPASHSHEHPNSKEYCDLLVRHYELDRGLDELLGPINEIAKLIGRGSTWNSETNLHRQLNFFLDSHCELRLYKSCPAFGVKWLSLLQAIEAEPNDLMTFASSDSVLESRPECTACSWFRVCGGSMFAGCRTKMPVEVADAHCRHRLLFLCHFAASFAQSVSSLSINLSVPK